MLSRMDYAWHDYQEIPFPEVSEAEVGTFNHANLRSVRMGSYCGSSSEDTFLLKLLEMAPSLEMVIIDTKLTDFVHQLRHLKKMKLATTRDEAKERASNLKSNFPPHTQLLTI
ncbi:unnamed protein product [Cuscuta campestris]|uniref:Uncharacterized protein n=1 Tax=Cuscuta campestris TaxID=132261 RepID=A0A484LQ67_9ASTE|nr:unnamed protein product [Cuscuta campestris]